MTLGKGQRTSGNIRHAFYSIAQANSVLAAGLAALHQSTKFSYRGETMSAAGGHSAVSRCSFALGPHPTLIRHPWLGVLAHCQSLGHHLTCVPGLFLISPRLPSRHLA